MARVSRVLDFFTGNRSFSHIKLIIINITSLGDIINQWRDTLDLEDITFSDGPCLAETLRIPFTYCWSPALVPKPLDWDSHIGKLGLFAEMEAFTYSLLSFLFSFPF